MWNKSSYWKSAEVKNKVHFRVQVSNEWVNKLETTLKGFDDAGVWGYRELNEGLNLDQIRGENLREKAFKEKLKNVIEIRGTEWGNSIQLIGAALQRPWSWKELSIFKKLKGDHYLDLETWEEWCKIKMKNGSQYM